MPSIHEKPLSCPYCGEAITVLVDDSLADQNYIEDCQVCCRPIVVQVFVDFDGVRVTAQAENE